MLENLCDMLKVLVDIFLDRPSYRRVPYMSRDWHEEEQSTHAALGSPMHYIAVASLDLRGTKSTRDVQ
jgi:hypothetical protein